MGQAFPMPTSSTMARAFTELQFSNSNEFHGEIGTLRNADIDDEELMAVGQGSAFARLLFLSTAPKGDRVNESEHPCPPITHKQKFPHLLQVERYGEAKNPGPTEVQQPDEFEVVIGTTNTTGLRQKETQILELGEGIWSFAETHLTMETFRTCKSQLKFLAKQQSRTPRFHQGAPTTPRINSTWAGTWSGVAQLLDFACTPINLDWPQPQWETSRVLTMRHWAGGTPITVSTIYGYPQGPTWPKAKKLTDELLSHISTNVVLGMDGVRIIAGDYNANPGELREHQLWQQLGWVNAQCHALDRWSQSRTPTCKNSTERDQIWLSPEAVRLLRKVEVTHDFVDHSTVKVTLGVPFLPQRLYAWPRPSNIEWPKDLTAYHQQAQCNARIDKIDPTGSFARWATDFENEIRFENDEKIPSRCRGRAQRLQPECILTSASICKASRPGEIELKHDLVGGAIRKWFQHARKLQSLRFALLAGKMSPEAIEYRVTLWSSIPTSKGFEGGFRRWWIAKEQLTPDGGGELPIGVPSIFEISTIYVEFMEHFRRFERLHLQARGKLLREKYELNMKHLFQDLRPMTRDTPDLFWEDLQFEVIDADEETGELRLEPSPVHHEGDQWMMNGQMISLFDFAGDCCKVQPGSIVGIGDSICQRIFTSSVTEMHAKLTEYWRPRWQRVSEVPEDQWRRITLFAQAYIPRIDFNWRPLTTDEVRNAAKKMKVTAARGPDGFARLDIVKMAEPHLQMLVNMLTLIEKGEMNWPSQLLLGFVICVAKTSTASMPAHYRPITLFAVVYRLWASLRTKHVLSQLKHWLPQSIFGFMPEREAAQVWQVLQGIVEMALNTGEMLAGLSADLAKAFNFIGRSQTFYLARHATFPPEIIVPWAAFVDNIQRRFDLNGNISPSVGSSSGFPEGCPMSIVSMLLANWAHHQYMAAYEPNIRVSSYVDNITLVADCPQQLMSGLLATKVFYELWGLQLDEEKTVTWALDSTMRKELRHMSCTVALDAKELGGLMNYSKSSRAHRIVARQADMAPKWTRLRKSPAPQRQKIQILPMAFWSSLLHGVSNRAASNQHLTELRRQACKAIGLCSAGTNPILRLSLTDTPKADPGFYQLCTVMSNFMRIAEKSEEFCLGWGQFLTEGDGKAPGPFSTFGMHLGVINWTAIDAKHLIDHRGHTHHLWLHDRQLLANRLHEAWLQHIAANVKHKTMADLEGIEPSLTLLDTGRMNRLERSRLLALHSGAFISSSQKSKFDSGHAAVCDLCQVKDDRVHWLCCPRFQAHREHFPWDWPSQQAHIPACTLYHLLVPWQPELHELDNYYVQLAAEPWFFQSWNVVPGVQHLFLDGTCKQGTNALMAYAAWGVIHAGTEEIVIAEHLGGGRQSIDRAEISALVAAATWCQIVDRQGILWSDSASTVDTAEKILRSQSLRGIATNVDLWHTFLRLVQRLHPEQVQIRWIPSHQDLQEAADPYEEWCIRWNDAVDRLVDNLNLQRPKHFWQSQHNMQQCWNLWAERIRVLRKFYLNVAGETGSSSRVNQGIHTYGALLEDDHMIADSFVDQLPVNWRILAEGRERLFPTSFVHQMVEQIARWDQCSEPIQLYSDIEICLALALDRSFHFPTLEANTLKWSARSYFDHFERPLITKLLRAVTPCLDLLVDCFGLTDFRVVSFSSPQIGLLKTGKAFYLRMPQAQHVSMRCQMASLVRRRPFRSAADMARPIN